MHVCMYVCMIGAGTFPRYSNVFDSVGREDRMFPHQSSWQWVSHVITLNSHTYIHTYINSDSRYTTPFGWWSLFRAPCHIVVLTLYKDYLYYLQTYMHACIHTYMIHVYIHTYWLERERWRQRHETTRRLGNRPYIVAGRLGNQAVDSIPPRHYSTLQCLYIHIYKYI